MTKSSTDIDVDVLVVGAGVTGIEQLHRALEAGFSARLLEAGDGVGGVWYWNRYPGARLDSESYTYGYLFSEELFKGWEWQERFAGQPENERYFNYAVDTLNLRQHITFGARVTAAEFDESSGTWLVRASDGTEVRTRFLIAATGVLSIPVFPNVPGRNDFRGIQHHTGLWPDDPVDFRGKRVAVIGTGSSGVQVIPAVAGEVASLTVYQRTPNWCTPLGNEPIDARQQAELKSGFEQLRETLDESVSGFLHQLQETNAFDVPEAERRAFYEKMWTSPGFSKVISHYADVLNDPTANADWCEFMSGKIREIVEDPATAEKLIPKDHGWAGKRPPFTTDYFEVYNDPKVSLVDLRETPITRVTESGIETTDGLREFDIIVWASGFDFGTGALNRMGIRGRDGLALEEYWSDGPHTFAGVMAHGFPNFFFPAGPHGAAGNNPRYGGDQVQFVDELIRYARDHEYTAVEVPEQVEDAWNRMVAEMSVYSSFGDSSYFYGTNIEGKPKAFLLNPAGRPKLREALGEVLESKYQGFLG
ncbi:flavin-containing monooxygenase [Nocardia macrotermitis]|uniref:2-oxo-Delta(3)-4,5, 5-trimethylcyclopentenylacetyl-CoA monooxygenase n=1 Tax=Nocardia macrotermitis TaxID=2585198 RepID=A0A7K0D7D5_9NOCA|nr:NAD(P)/FAD-dependent oxidoreductase [Nocardia macrotermitis]MQY21471.1 2-oxo-Delta(3)-4,5,5-trimethylcyclopentenylacetyl-CoA monooxygenase [Nocardia macrotermitis]